MLRILLAALAVVLFGLIGGACATTKTDSAVSAPVTSSDGTIQDQLRKQWGSETIGFRPDGYLVICLPQTGFSIFAGDARKGKLNMELLGGLVGLKCPSGSAFVRGMSPEYLIDSIGQPLCGRVKVTEVEVVCEDCDDESSTSGSGLEEMEKKIDLQFEEMEKKIDREFEDTEKKLR
ncbi:MAG TPA: hypothetical protein DEB73_00525 [Candidatus Magasanikbacteria bacterium]|uniref:Uncharacterized protein n=2 Tax=Candidatus Magasanikiibacteriota TaxID=1752731 RepID=A0A0G0ZJA7_9BACT|nr:MAG: hypothetical protein UU49_C0002G0032 [Candidatus Magasanikbacteria bacterium GW2011_GWC2_41_17]KKS13058.1 MAG: hypothetical protein UU69_C0014G0002 [Candidatus Magasanikbacteria bacterium GW2011_GWA2_41_55]HBV57748.1 hypothetical protein [Candidatus Magasanikbacteria bacterium]HBX15732.1 hypothetical protein [Candidatus Magasanikbacteria bacterium]